MAEEDGDATPIVVPESEPAPEASAETEPEGGIPEHLKEYVSGLRKESADRRVANKGWDDAFNSFDASDQSYIQE